MISGIYPRLKNGGDVDLWSSVTLPKILDAAKVGPFGDMSRAEWREGVFFWVRSVSRRCLLTLFTPCLHLGFSSATSL